MKKQFGLVSLILLGTNAIIGSGIYLLPGKAFALAGRDSLWVYLFDSILALLLALTFAEAAGRFDKAGGPYIYAKEAFGEFVGFEVGRSRPQPTRYHAEGHLQAGTIRYADDRHRHQHDTHHPAHTDWQFRSTGGD